MISLNALFFLTGVIQGLVLSFVLYFRSGLNSLSRKFLIGIILAITFQIFLKVLSKDWLLDYFSIWAVIAYQIPFLFGPLTYLFVKYTIGINPSFKRADLTHLLPYVVVSLAIVLLHLGVYAESESLLRIQFFLPNNLSRGILYISLQLISILAYGIASAKLCSGFESLAAQQSSSLKKTRVTWLRNFIVASAICGAVVATILFLMYNLYPFHQWIRFGLIVQVLLIYWITYHAITEPSLFQLIQVGASKDEAHVRIIQGGLTPVKKYSHNHLPDTDAMRIKEKLEAWMRTEEPYLKPELSLDEVAIALGESKHSLSRVINERLTMNFFEYVNGFRIEKARKMLADPGKNHLTIAAIAFESGFNSISAFNLVFKKYVSTTPSAYKKIQQKENAA